MANVVEMKKKTVEEKTGTDLQIEVDAIAMQRRTLISKIKVDKKFHTMTINYSGFNKKASKETVFTGYEEMILEKYFVIQSLKEAVCEILSFPESWINDIVITGISLNYDAENNNALRGWL